MCWRRYYFTAALVDNPMVGRLRIQIFGFLGVGTLFMVSAGAYGPLTTPGGIGTFQFLYFFSSFVVRSRPRHLHASHAHPERPPSQGAQTACPRHDTSVTDSAH